MMKQLLTKQKLKQQQFFKVFEDSHNSDFNANNRNAARKRMTDMNEYAIKAVNKFKNENGRTLHKVTSSYLTNEDVRNIH